MKISIYSLCLSLLVFGGVINAAFAQESYQRRKILSRISNPKLQELARQVYDYSDNKKAVHKVKTRLSKIKKRIV